MRAVGRSERLELSRRTGIFLEVRIGCLEEDLDSVERCDDGLCLLTRERGWDVSAKDVTGREEK